MTHSSLMRTLRRALRQAHQQNLLTSSEARAATARLNYNWSRRRFLKLAALASGSALLPRGLAHANAPQGDHLPNIAIIGAGIAGLNAAYQLKKAGLVATVYEARDRVGGRIRSVTGAVEENLVIDLGGHLINSNHEDMIALAAEFDIPLFNRAEDAATLPFPTTAYFLDDTLVAEADLANQLCPLASQILADAVALEEDFEAVAPELDQLSVTDYLNQHQSKIPHPKVRTLLEQTIRTEFGAEPADSSALQLLFNLPLVEADSVELLSESDEVFVVKGGSARITDALAVALGDQVHTGMALTSLKRHGAKYQLQFGRTEIEADYVILALPFSILRDIEVRTNLPRKLKKFIAEVDLGKNDKLIAGFNNRIWRREAGFTQEVWTDRLFSQAWEETQRQPTQTSAALTFFFGGSQQVADLNQGSPRSVGRRLLQRFEQIIPGSQRASNGRFLRTAWTADPFSRGAYSTFRPGQLTEFADLFYIESEDLEERQEARIGNLLFAGEQVSDEFWGFMNGGAQTGRLAAESLIRELTNRSI